MAALSCLLHSQQCVCHLRWLVRTVNTCWDQQHTHVISQHQQLLSPTLTQTLYHWLRNLLKKQWSGTKPYCLWTNEAQPICVAMPNRQPCWLIMWLFKTSMDTYCQGLCTTAFKCCTNTMQHSLSAHSRFSSYCHCSNVLHSVKFSLCTPCLLCPEKPRLLKKALIP